MYINRVYRVCLIVRRYRFSHSIIVVIVQRITREAMDADVDNRTGRTGPRRQSASQHHVASW